MDEGQFADILKNRLSGYFDIQNDICWDGSQFAFKADFSARMNQTVLTKSRIMDFCESREILLFTTEKDFSRDKASAAMDFCREKLAAIAEPSRHHKSTVITRIFAVSSFLSEEERKDVVSMIKKYRYSKSHLFMLHGFSEVKSVLADFSAVSSGGAVKLTFSPAARSYKKLFQFNDINTKEEV